MSQRYNKLPSEIIHIDDDYIAYCFDEAISEFIYRIEQKQTPRFESSEPKGENPGLKVLLG